MATASRAVTKASREQAREAAQASAKAQAKGMKPYISTPAPAPARQVVAPKPEATPAEAPAPAAKPTRKGKPTPTPEPAPAPAPAAQEKPKRKAKAKETPETVLAGVSSKVTAPDLADIAADAVTGDDEAAGVVMERVAALVTLLQQTEARVAEAVAEAKRETEKAQRIATEDLPELLREAGLSSVTLTDGTKVVVGNEINCGISEDRSEEAHKWLREHNYGALIKSMVGVSFGKDEVGKADTLMVQLVKKYGMDNVTRTEKVHPATLKSFLKGLMAAKTPFPLPLFGVHPYSMAKVSAPKAKKGAAS